MKLLFKFRSLKSNVILLIVLSVEKQTLSIFILNTMIYRYIILKTRSCTYHPALLKFGGFLPVEVVTKKHKSNCLVI